MKILVVSDDALFSRLTTAKLKKWGHRVATETTAEAALERFAKEPFRAVVTAWDLEGMSGTELCGRIRELNLERYVYVVVYTSRQEKDDMMASLEAGADDHLIRPFNPRELRLRLESAKRLLNLEDDLRAEASVDSATGLVNDASFRHFFRVMLAQTRRTASSGALLFVELDNYREVVAEHGARPARKMLIEVANALRRATRESDMAGRTAEDAFCVILQNTYQERCARVCRQIDGLVENMSLHIDDVELHPRVSMSIINFPVENLSSDEILSLPDRVPFKP